MRGSFIERYGVVVLLAFSVLWGRAEGEDAEKEKGGEILRRSFRTPMEFFSIGRDPDGGWAAGPVDPFAPAGGAKLKPKGRSPRTILADLGIHLGEGESAIFLPSSGMLFVAATREKLGLIERVFREMEVVERTARVRVEVYTLAEEDAVKVAKPDDIGGAGGARALAGVRDLLENGKAELLYAPFLALVDDERAKVESGRRLRFITGYRDHEGKDDPVWENVLEGMSFEVSGEILPKLNTVQLVLDAEFSYGEIRVRKAVIAGPATGAPREVQLPEGRRHQISGSFLVCGGEPQLIGRFPGNEGDEKVVLVFLGVELGGLAEGGDSVREKDER